MATQTLQRESLDSLTGLRFFAALQVVLFHFGAGFAARHHLPAWGLAWLDSGWCAVCLFFVLSGFVLAYSYQGKIQGITSSGRFWQARFARIYPVYLASLLLCFHNAFIISWKLKIASLTMVQSWNPFHPAYGGSWNMPTWTLSVEAFFYLLFPLLIVLLDKANNRGVWILFWCLLGVILLARTELTGPSTPILAIPLPILRLPEFLLGLCAGLLFRRGVRLPWAGWISLASVAAAVAIMASGHPQLLRFIILPFAFLIFSLAHGTGTIAKALSTKVLLLLGGASYSVYLLQEPVRILLHEWIGRQGDGLDTYLFVPVLICFAVLVFRFYEEPMRHWLKAVPLFQAKPRVRVSEMAASGTED